MHCSLLIKHLEGTKVYPKEMQQFESNPTVPGAKSYDVPSLHYEIHEEND